ncbi:MAG: GDSL-type esterase/lipase family protein [Patescibacteria group bacterium]
MGIETKLILLILSAIAIFEGYNFIHTQRLIKIGIAQTEETPAYERRLDKPEQRFLIIGDSSAVGVGAEPSTGSIAGRLAADYPTADVMSLAVSGSKVKDAIKQLKSLPDTAKFDLILIQIGGNDIVRRTPYADLERDFPIVLKLAKQHSDHVVQLTSGNVGTSKLLPLGTRWFFTLRTKRVRNIFMRINSEQNTAYVDLYRKPAVDPYAQNPKLYYSPDFFHPSATGYGDWYSFTAPIIKDLLGSE